MEALGAAASVVAIIQIAERIATACISYVDGVQGYPKDLRVIYVEVNSLKVVFESLKFLDPNEIDDAATIQALKAPKGPIEGCKQAMQELNGLIPSATPTDEARGHKRRRIRSALDTLAWPLKAERARKLLDDLTLHKSTVNMALTGQLLQDVRLIKSDVRKTTEALSESQRRDICNWFEKVNPSSNHNSALNLYVEGTGDWVFRSQPWKDWVGLRTRSLWLHGIPGSGKTILAAHATQAVMEYCRQSNNPKIICVYYYCYHGRNQDETAYLMRWLLGQLFRKAGHISQRASDFFENNQEPNLVALKSMLKESLQDFDRVFVMIDALDESQPFECLLSLLRELTTENEYRKVQLFTTSRQYTAIEQTMLGISESLSLSNPWVEEDIKRYVSVQIEGNRAFRSWPVDLRRQVKDKLSAEANGMFRWAVCQLDILRRLKTTEEILEALTRLPETLDETYERIFAMIHPEDRQLVRHVIRWIYFWSLLHDVNIDSVLTCSMLLKIYEMCTEPPDKPRSIIVDVEMLKEICGCLFVYESESGEPSFAHYTVREFLESDRLSSISSYFRISSKEDCEYIIIAVFRRAIATRQNPKDVNVISDLNGFCSATALDCLRYLEPFIPPDLAFEFLCPTSPLNFQSSQDSTETFFPIRNLLRKWEPVCVGSPIPSLCLQLIVLECPNLIQVCLQRYGIKQSFGTNSTFGVPEWPWWHDHNTDNDVVGGGLKFYGNLLELIAFCNDHNRYFTSDEEFFLYIDLATGIVDLSPVLLYYAPNHGVRCPCRNDGYECFLRQLLRRGARTGSVGYRVTPLQIMCAFCDLNGVQVLLYEGADPDEVGDANVPEWGSSHVLGEFAHLHGLSPLQIVRHHLMLGVFYNRYDDRNEIEQLLVAHSRKRLEAIKD